MSFARPFSYNIGEPIPGTTQVGDLAIGAPTSGVTSYLGFLGTKNMTNLFN